ncbi:MAG TPA: DUF2911 domain-containing protein [Chitinophagaceae bacterium]|jgi:hypothetical protein|nr:DUF2911 domain-containing protein [Chitinophagaceae bacterium]
MTRISFFKTFAITLFIACTSLGAFAQGAAKSPADSATGKFGDATVKIKYSSPSVNGRKIWGGLEPYGKVWRAGANNATTFTVDKNVQVEGKTLPAGKYAFFVIPTEGADWTVIFNKVAEQWGAFKYDQAQDALRVSVKPRKSAALKERLAYSVNPEGVVLQWENVELPVAIK